MWQPASFLQRGTDWWDAALCVVKAASLRSHAASGRLSQTKELKILSLLQKPSPTSVPDSTLALHGSHLRSHAVAQSDSVGTQILGKLKGAFACEGCNHTDAYNRCHWRMKPNPHLPELASEPSVANGPQCPDPWPATFLRPSSSPCREVVPVSLAARGGSLLFSGSALLRRK